MNANFFSNAFTGSLAFLVTLIFFHPIERPDLQTFAQTTYQNIQMTTLNLQREGLKTPCLLSISPSSSINRLQGQVLLNGKVINRLDSKGVTLNLSSQLKPGSNRLVITGQYTPVDEIVSIHLEGLNTEIDQQTGGNGVLNQTLVIEVN
jgi:hypothetical protein